jgi:hypothetical protein
MGRVGRTTWALPVSLGAHAALAVLLAGQRPASRDRGRDADLVEIDLREGQSAPAQDPAPTPLVAPDARIHRPAPAAGHPHPRERAKAAAPIALRVPPGNDLRLHLNPSLAPSSPPLSLRLRDGRGERAHPSADPAPDARTQVQGVQTTANGLTARIAANGSLTFSAPSAVGRIKPDFQTGTVGLGGTLDVNDMISRAAGQDPYAYEKRKIADATFEDRLALAREADRRLKQEALFKLKDQLESLLHLPALTASGRRQVIFEMWDECIEDAADGEPDLGAAARATLLAFIRRALPAGSPEGYTSAELAALNRRRTSRARFDPYGTPAIPPLLGRPVETAAAQPSVRGRSSE